MIKRFIRRNPVFSLIVMPMIISILLGSAFGYACAVYKIKSRNADVETESKPAAVETVEYTYTASPRQYNEVTVTATAYCPCAKCCGKSDGITATGTKATAGRTIAADTRIFPYGTELIINGHTYIVEDCGGAIKGNKIDIFFNTHEEALRFGRRVLPVKYYFNEV